MLLGGRLLLLHFCWVARLEAGHGPGRWVRIGSRSSGWMVGVVSLP